MSTMIPAREIDGEMYVRASEMNGALAAEKDRADTWHAAFLEVTKAAAEVHRQRDRALSLAALDFDVPAASFGSVDALMDVIAQRAALEDAAPALLDLVREYRGHCECEGAPCATCVKADSLLARTKEILADPQVDAAMKRLADR